MRGARRPQTRYARSGDLSIAYQVFGDGPLDLVYIPGWVSHLEHLWELPSAARFLRRLGTFGRVVTFDKRGTGMSDRVPADQVPTPEERLDDFRCVLEAAGVERAAFFGFSEGGSGAAMFAALYPERVLGIALYGAAARYAWAEDYPHGWRPEVVDGLVAYIREKWGSGEGVAVRAPSMVGDPAFERWFAAFERLGATPTGAAHLIRMNHAVDLRDAIRMVRVPTLILHRTRDRVIDVEHSRYLHGLIPHSRLVELSGEDHFPWLGDAEEVLGAVEEFFTGELRAVDPDRFLGVILFTDIVDSTRRLEEMGDVEWSTRLARHYDATRRLLHRYEGQEIKTTGDGMLALFEGPERAVRCALATVQAAGDDGLALRAGLHMGECRVSGDDVSGKAVHIAARVVAVAAPDEVLVSRALRDVVAAPDISLHASGVRELKGLPGGWELYRAEDEARVLHSHS